MPKTNKKKKKKGDQKNLLINYIFLKVVMNNISGALSANHFTQQINIISILQYKEENFLTILIECHKLFDNHSRMTTVSPLYSRSLL